MRDGCQRCCLRFTAFYKDLASHCDTAVSNHNSVSICYSDAIVSDSFLLQERSIGNQEKCHSKQWAAAYCFTVANVTVTDTDFTATLLARAFGTLRCRLTNGDGETSGRTFCLEPEWKLQWWAIGEMAFLTVSREMYRTACSDIFVRFPCIVAICASLTEPQITVSARRDGLRRNHDS